MLDTEPAKAWEIYRGKSNKKARAKINSLVVKPFERPFSRVIELFSLKYFAARPVFWHSPFQDSEF